MEGKEKVAEDSQHNTDESDAKGDENAKDNDKKTEEGKGTEDTDAKVDKDTILKGDDDKGEKGKEDKNDKQDDVSIEDLQKKYDELKGKVPKVPEKYKLEIDKKDVEKGFVDPDKLKGFAEDALKQNLTQEQFDWLVAKDKAANEAMVKEVSELLVKQKNESETALKKEWSNDYSKNVKIADSALSKYMKLEGLKKDELSDYLNDSKFIKIMHFFGTKISEDSFEGDAASTQSKIKRDAYNQIIPDYKVTKKK